MENQILDSPFQDDFHFDLDQDEEILWKENPSHRSFISKEDDNSKYSIKWINFFIVIVPISILIFTMLYWLTGFPFTLFLVAIIMFALLRYDYVVFNRKKKEQYIVTSKRVIMHEWKEHEDQFQTEFIPLSEIQRIEVYPYSLSGTKGKIILAKKAPLQNINFFPRKNHVRISMETVKDSIQLSQIIRERVEKL